MALVTAAVASMEGSSSNIIRFFCLKIVVSKIFLRLIDL